MKNSRNYYMIKIYFQCENRGNFLNKHPNREVPEK